MSVFDYSIMWAITEQKEKPNSPVLVTRMKMEF